MKTANSIPWDKVYGDFDGTMTNCLGSGCHAPCCGEKYVASEDGATHRYRTILFDTTEVAHQSEIGPLEELGVSTTPVVIKGAVTETRVLVNGCLDVATGTCKLADRKPLACRIFPIRLNSQNPLDNRCIQAKKIAQETDALVQIGEVRKTMGHSNTQEWLSALRRASQ